MITYVIGRLCAYGGETQFFMLLTVPAGAGKSTAVKAHEQFTCNTANTQILHGGKQLYIAYTGLAAAQLNRVTICKKSGTYEITIKETPFRNTD